MHRAQAGAEPTERPLVYFICPFNASRSQMAEGFARTLAGDRCEIRSGGLLPTRLDPRAVVVMLEAGVDISAHRAKPVDPACLRRAAAVISLCGDADDLCPVVPPSTRHLHWEVPDPAHADGTEPERLEAFRRIRNTIYRRVSALLEDAPSP